MRRCWSIPNRAGTSWPWFAEFLAAIPRYESNTVASTRLAIAAREHLFGWAREEGIEFDERHEGILHVYRDKAGFEHAARVTGLLAQGGLQRRAVTPAEMRAIEPTLEGRFYGGFYTESDSTGDIHKFTVGLAQAAEARGVRMVCGADVRGLQAAAKARRLRSRWMARTRHGTSTRWWSAPARPAEGLPPCWATVSTSIR